MRQAHKTAPGSQSLAQQIYFRLVSKSRDKFNALRPRKIHPNSKNRNVQIEKLTQVQKIKTQIFHFKIGASA